MNYQSVTIEDARYRCAACGREWVEDLSPLWMGYDGWPTCSCGQRPYLLGRVIEGDIVYDDGGSASIAALLAGLLALTLLLLGVA